MDSPDRDTVLRRRAKRLNGPDDRRAAQLGAQMKRRLARTVNDETSAERARRLRLANAPEYRDLLDAALARALA